jgi:hypothetical protein
MTIISGQFSAVTPTQFTNQTGFFSRAQIFGIRGYGANGVSLGNSGVAYVGVGSTILPISVPTGGVFDWGIPDKRPLSLGQVYFRGNIGDGIYMIAH